MKYSYVGISISAILFTGIVLLFVFNNSSTPQPIKTTPKVPHATNSQKPSIMPTKYPISHGKIPSLPFRLSSEFTIHIFADTVGNPRDMVFSPGGTLLVSNPATNQVFALPDSNNDGVSDQRKIIINGENHVHGLAFYNNKLYIADVDKVVRYNWDETTLTATKDKVLFLLPENNDHNNRVITFNASGQMFVSVGSTCNVCSETPEQGGSVYVSDAEGNTPYIFASGLRNAGFTTINPATGELWGTEMGRDYLGDTIPSDEINIIRNGKNYGWPLCYGNKIHDTSFDKHQYIQDPCTDTVAPIYEIPAHSAPLGLAFINSPQFPSNWQGDLLVAYHGDWNRSTPIGYTIVHLKVTGNSVTSSEDFLTGFLTGDTKESSAGRPVDVLFDTQGNLYVSDDKAGNIYIIQKK
ncbi:MAG TPA: PQQ-dependent sugar dehydrogenase [Candidatus Saccharimonadales bacterium]|nr:PQQ-dependent sugar dehydrogenase [Candidatus Saccharimonadales bacterium]